MQRKSARVIVFSKQDNESIYLIYRNKNDDKYYVTPGGGIDTGENEVEAAEREIMEELGLKITNLNLVDDKDGAYLFTANEVEKFDFTGKELKNTNPNNYYEVQLHKIKDINSLNLKPLRYKDIINNLKEII